MAQTRYSAYPFNHWVVEAAIDELAIEQVNRCWPGDDDKRWLKEDGRFNIKWSMEARDGILEELMKELSSPSMCEIVAGLIGEKQVFSDKRQFGGGLHAIPPGGFLGMHHDFKFHPRGYKRVANALLYVNQEWQEDWGGALQLGLNGGSVQYLPLGGRIVIFRTDQNSWHGHPQPTRTPEGIMRRSIACYYYTKERGVPDKTVYMKQ